MSEAWIKVAVKTLRDPKVVTLSSDAVRWAWVAILLAAKEQTPPGHFDSEPHLRAVVSPTVGEHLTELVEKGLLNVDPEGGIAPARWRRYQIDPTAADRQKRVRERDGRDIAVTKTVTGRDIAVTRHAKNRDGHTLDIDKDKDIDKKLSIQNGKTESVGDVVQRALKAVTP
jgi:hypothetical protein